MRFWLNRVALQALAILFACVSWALAEEPKLGIGSPELSQLELVSNLADYKPEENDFRIYFVGNSITRHGVDAGIIERLKWDHVAGMAASSEEKDYAHLLAGYIGKELPDRKIKLFFGAGSNPVHAMQGIDTAKKFAPHLIVVQLGEHVTDATKVEQEYDELLAALQEVPAKPLILAAGPWCPMPGKTYSGLVAQVEKIQKAVAGRKKIPFASVEKYALDPSCSGYGETPGVKWHPNDKGMEGYARELFRLFRENHQRSGKTPAK